MWGCCFLRRLVFPGQLLADIEVAAEDGAGFDFEFLGTDVSDELGVFVDADFVVGRDVAVQLPLDVEVFDVNFGSDIALRRNGHSAAGFNVGNGMVVVDAVVFETDALVAVAAIHTERFGAGLERLAAMGAVVDSTGHGFNLRGSTTTRRHRRVATYVDRSI